MTVRSPDNNRRLLPRWRTLIRSVELGELKSPLVCNSLHQPKKGAPIIDHIISDWHKKNSIENAAELVSAGIIIGINPIVSEAARYLIDNKREIAPAILQAAKIVLGDIKDIHHLEHNLSSSIQNQVKEHLQISILKNRLRSYPLDSISWIELARLYTILGQKKSAMKAINIAVSLAPDNRFVLRAAARFFVHSHEPDQGLYLIRKSTLTKHDPWLQATEISISAVSGLKSSYMKSASRFMKKEKWSPWDTAELYGAAATTISIDGNFQQAKKLMKLSTRDPNENALTQAQWASIRGWASPINPDRLTSQSAPEAVAISARENRNWNLTIDACWKWNEMEPTSSRPLFLGSFVALVALEDGVNGLKFMEKADVLIPKNVSVYNNLAVSAAYSGDVVTANQYFNKLNSIHGDLDTIPTYKATKGLLCYRSGDISSGRKNYIDAINLSRKRKDIDLTLLVLWHMFREESKYGTRDLEVLAEYMFKKFPSVYKENPEIESLFEQIYLDLDTSRYSEKWDEWNSLQEYKEFTNCLERIE